MSIHIHDLTSQPHKQVPSLCSIKCACILPRLHTYAKTHTYTNIHAHTHTYIHTHILYLHMYVHTDRHTQREICKYIYRQLYSVTHTYAHILTCIDPYRHKHTHVAIDFSYGCIYRHKLYNKS